MLKKIINKIQQLGRPTGPDDRPMIRCPSCKKLIFQKDIDRSWGWAGPSCPYCHAGGMGFFADVIEQEHSNGIQHSRR